MSRQRKYWTRSRQYQRIEEILEAYWLNCPDEAFVMVDMYFRKRNGEEQTKEIVWYNPSFAVRDRNTIDAPVNLADITNKPAESFYEMAARKSSEFLDKLV